jgi:hypothetical protein
MEKATQEKQLELEDRRRRKSEYKEICATVDTGCSQASFEIAVAADTPWEIDRWFAEIDDAPHVLCTLDPMWVSEDEVALIAINTRRIGSDLSQCGLERNRIRQWQHFFQRKIYTPRIRVGHTVL